MPVLSGTKARNRAALFGSIAGLLTLVGCSGARELQQPLRPGQVRADERRAFACFMQQLPSLLREDYGSFHSIDGGLTDSWYASPENSRYYIRDVGGRVEFYVAGKSPPREAMIICADSCGDFVVSYAKNVKDCNARTEEPRWHP